MKLYVFLLIYRVGRREGRCWMCGCLDWFLGSLCRVRYFCGREGFWRGGGLGAGVWNIGVGVFLGLAIFADIIFSYFWQ
jgi:hypothetical protein